MSRLMPPENRRAVVLFLRGPVAERVDAIRRRWDPVMTGRIDAHVTLVHQATDHAAVEQRVAELAATTPPFDVTLTGTACWSTANYGVYLEVDDPTGTVGALHRALADLEAPAWSRVAFRPHVTLVHGRTVDPALAGSAWTALCDQRAGWSAPLTAMEVIELDEPTGWTS